MAEQHRVRLTKDDDYYCPVDGCDKRCRSPITLKRHYTEKGPHEVEEMLDAGIAVWFYRTNAHTMVEDTIAWLVERGYVTPKVPSERPAVVDADDESADDDIF